MAVTMAVSVVVLSQIPAQALGRFWDDDGSIHEPAIEAIASAGITNGCGLGRYCPAEAVTRAQMASFLVRALDLPPGASGGFADVVGHPHEADIDSLASAGIAKGCAAGRYCPDEPVSRAETASFLVRALGLAASSGDTFTDDDGSLHEPDIDALAAAGVTRGCGGTRFCPHMSLTRAEMATLLARALGLALPAIPPSDYEVPLVVPSCDPSDPTVRLISTVADWQDVNNQAYRVFCVAPGDYRAAGQIDLEIDGTPSAPRWIRYTEPTHPIARSAQAVVSGLAFDADYWIVQGLTQRGGSIYTEFRSGSEYNVLDRMLAEGGQTTSQVRIRPGAHNNTVQNSVLRNTQREGDHDRGCVLLWGSNNGNPVVTNGTRIVNNEIYNCTDGIGLHRDSATPSVDYGGTIIHNNDIYITNVLYSDGAGNLNSAGEYACAENAIDIKAGGVAGNPVVVSGNRVWGFRQTDVNCGGTGSWGQAILSTEGARYTLFYDNWIWDSGRGISLSDDSRFHSVIDNVIYNIHSSADTASGFAEQDYALMISSPDTEVYRNVVVASAYAWGRVAGDNNDYRCNVIIDGGRVRSPGSGITADYNFYYNAEQLALPGTHDVVSTLASEANHADLFVEARRWTGPVTVRIPNAAATSASPHAGACDPSLGSRPGIGINDQLWN
jgi:hypothetical protein